MARKMPYKAQSRKRKKMPGVPLEGAIKRRLSGTRSIPESSSPKGVAMPSGRTITKPSAPAGPGVAMPAKPGGTRSVPGPLGGGKPTMSSGSTPLARAVTRRLRGGRRPMPAKRGY